MRNLFKKGISAVIALSMAASMAVMIPITASAATGGYAANTEDGGVTGTWANENIGSGSWSFDASSGTITFTGTGVMPYGGNYTAEIKKTNNNYVSSIKHIVIGEGITNVPAWIGRNMIESAGAVIESISWSKDVTEIERYIDSHFETLQNITNDFTNVKFVRNGALSGCNVISGELSLPDIETLENHAFSYNKGITKVILGKNLSHIETDAFVACDSLTAYEVDENNEYYCAVDGVLFTKDKKTLVAYPTGKKGAYSIPEGTEVISNAAFYKTVGLTELNIPTSVKSLGNFDEEGTEYTLYLGGNTALTAINVDENNTELKSVDGVLVSGDGTQLLSYPTAKENGEIPSTVKEIKGAALNNVPAETTITYNGDNADIARSIAKAAMIETNNTEWKATAPTATGDNRFNESTFKAWADGDNVGAMGFISTITGGSVPESFKTTNDKGADTTAVKTAVDKITWTITIGEKQYQKTFNGTTVSLDADGQATIKVLIDGFDETQYNAGITAVSTSLD